MAVEWRVTERKVYVHAYPVKWAALVFKAGSKAGVDLKRVVIRS